MIIQTNKDKYRVLIDKASKWVKQFVMMLIATYVSFTVAINLLGFNQRGASLLVSLGLFVIIIGVLSYTIWLIKKSKKLFTDDLVDKIMKTDISKAYESKKQ